MPPQKVILPKKPINPPSLFPLIKMSDPDRYAPPTPLKTKARIYSRYHREIKISQNIIYHRFTYSSKLYSRPLCSTLKPYEHCTVGFMKSILFPKTWTYFRFQH